jgi:hypothetical protein
MMPWFAMRRLRERKPPQQTMDAVSACLTELGFGSNHLTDEFSTSVAARLVGMVDYNRIRHEQRVTELLEANNRDVNRRRAAEQAMRGMLAYSREYAPEVAPALKTIADANGIKL